MVLELLGTRNITCDVLSYYILVFILAWARTRHKILSQNPEGSFQ
jgi:hypothetical protein